MRYFKDENNNIFAYEDNVNNKFIRQDLEEITEIQYKSFRLFGVFDKTKEEIEEYSKIKELEDSKNKLLQETQSLADFWSKEIKNYVAGKKLTQEQIERYNYKYEIALDCKTNDNYDVFNNEAEDAGLEPSDLVDLIIKLHDEWISTIKTNTLRIEYFRVAFNKNIEAISNLDGVELYKYKLQYAKDNYGINTTDDEVKQLLELTEIPESYTNA
jgi:hypothetical protein